jgi:hypothetical protein
MRETCTRHWKFTDREILSAKEIEGICLFLNQIRVMKDQGLSGVGVVVSFIRRRVQPLQDRVHYDFKYTGVRILPG